MNIRDLEHLQSTLQQALAIVTAELAGTSTHQLDSQLAALLSTQQQWQAEPLHLKARTLGYKAPEVVKALRRLGWQRRSAAGGNIWFKPAP